MENEIYKLLNSFSEKSRSMFYEYPKFKSGDNNRLKESAKDCINELNKLIKHLDKK